jgi:hypothetical protein
MKLKRNIMKLIKHKEGYSLCIEENGSNSREFIATTDGMYVKHRLSKQNCDELFWGLYNTEIEVEIVTHVDLAATPTDSRHPDAYLGTDTGIPFLDENGCLILKKK